MITVLAVAIAAMGGLLSLALRRIPRASGLGSLVALVVAAVCFAIAVGLPATDAATIGGVRVLGSPTVGVLLLGWSASLVVLGIVSLGVGGRDVTAAGLLGMAGATAGLAVDQPAVAFGALAASGVGAILGIGLRAEPRAADRPRRRALEPSARLGALDHGLTASLGTGILAMGLVAWAGSPIGAAASGAVVAVQTVAFQSGIRLAIVAMAVLAAIRAGAIPGHLWAAPLIGSLPERAVPAVVPWGSTVFVVVAVGWAATTLGSAGAKLDELDRWLIVVVGVGGLVLASLAAAVHDDLEHVFGYWIIQTASVALLAFAAPGETAVRAVADWGITSALIASVFAGWLALVRWSFAGGHRVSTIGGWARRSPLLAAAFLALLLAAAGLPGSALATARFELADAALPGAAGLVLALGAAAGSLVAFVRIALAGLRRPTGDVAAAPPERLGVLVTPTGGWSGGGSLARRAGRGAAIVRANRAVVLSVAVMVLALAAIGVAIVGVGTAG